ncbi:hypothetical protein [Streptomyces sp. NBC_00078]|uniref:hypothetical protein n=1 Tax=unclassified Streptomyces TaxID=2593676 RepID=UPI00225004E1|nr:hypothetical protein [Streptomyces sp. NBC_00078]MCX5425287.1 hypothetical protein [Streptomyces sp. NBC_00078]
MAQRVDWRTVGGGSISKVRKALAATGPDLRVSAPAVAPRQEPDHVAATTASGTERFDHAVLATHADEALALLHNSPSGRSRRPTCPSTGRTPGAGSPSSRPPTPDPLTGSPGEIPP